MQKTATMKELSALAGVTYRWLHDVDSKLEADKKLFVRADDGKYDVTLFVKHWVDYNVERVDSHRELSLDEVRAEHERVKKEKTELQVLKMRGELININDVRNLWGTVAATVTQNLLRLPSKIAPQVVSMPNVELISGIIEKEIRDVLTAVADTPVPDNDNVDYDEADSEE